MTSELRMKMTLHEWRKVGIQLDLVPASGADDHNSRFAVFEIERECWLVEYDDLDEREVSYGTSGLHKSMLEGVHVHREERMCWVSDEDGEALSIASVSNQRTGSEDE